MNQCACSPENSILEGDLELAILQKTVDKMKVMETPEGFYVVVQLKWASGKEWYLTTRRNRNMPKLFKDLKRLNDHLREAYPTDSFELYRNQELPQKFREPRAEKPAKPKIGKTVNSGKGGKKRVKPEPKMGIGRNHSIV